MKGKKLATDAHGCTRIENKIGYPCRSVFIRGSNWVRFYQAESRPRSDAEAGRQIGFVLPAELAVIPGHLGEAIRSTPEIGFVPSAGQYRARQIDPDWFLLLFAKVGRSLRSGLARPTPSPREGTAPSRPPSRQSGFALLLVFLMAAVVAITLYIEIPRVAFEAQRQKEQLLIARGEQYKRAIQVFFVNNKRYPASMDELKNLNGRRYLRQQYLDPMTGKSEWRLVHINGGVFTDSLLNAPKQQGQQGQAQQAQGQQGPPPGSITGGTYVGEGQQAIGAALNPQQQSVNLAMRRRQSDGGPATVDPAFGGFPPQTDSAGNMIGGAYPPGASPDQAAQTGVPPGVQPPLAPGSFPAAQPNSALAANSAAQAYAASALQAIPGAGQPGTGIAPTYIPQAQPNLGNYTLSTPVPGFPAVSQQQVNPPLPGGVQFGTQPFQSSQQVFTNPSSGGGSSYIGGGQTYIGGSSYVGGQSPTSGAQSTAFGAGQFTGQIPGMGFPGAPVNSQIGGVSPSPIGPSGYTPGGLPPSAYTPGGGLPPTAYTPGGGFPPAPFSYSTQPGAQGVSPGFPQPGVQTGVPPGSAPGQPGAAGQSPASQMIWNILTSPRPNVGQGSGGALNAQIGGGIAGIASKSEDEGIMIYDDRSKYKEWEFVFDLTKYRPPPNPLGGSVGTAASQLGSINPANPGLNAPGGISATSPNGVSGQATIGGPGFGNSAPQGGQSPFGPSPNMPGTPAPGAGGAFLPPGQTGLPELRMGQP